MLVAAVACSDAGGLGDDDGGSSDDTAGPVDLPTPDFIEPAGGELTITTVRTADLVLEVRASVGVTRLWVDGASVGTLTSDPRLGTLADDSLTVRLRGAMIAGIHALQLQTPDAVETEASESVMLTIESPPDGVFDWVSGEIVDEADALVVGVGDDGPVLGLVDDAMSSVRASPARFDAWDLSRSQTFSLAGYRPRGLDARVALSSVAGGLRVAWVVDDPGRAIAAAEATWEGEVEATRTGVDVGEWAGFDGREWLAIDRPLVVGPLVFALVHAPFDTESARPGDRVMTSVRWHDLDLRAPQLVPLRDVDLDLAQPVLDTLALDVPAVALRRASSEPILLAVDGASGSTRALNGGVDASDARWRGVAGPLVTTLGAFAARTVTGLADDGTALLTARIDDGGSTPPVVTRIALPDDAPAVSAIVGTVVDGRSVVLVPRGAAGLVALEVSSPDATPRVLDATCDAVAAVPIVVSDDGSNAVAASAAVDVACLVARDLSIGRLAVGPG